MDVEQERKRFEAYCEDLGLRYDRFYDEEEDAFTFYADIRADCAWDAWRYRATLAHKESD